MHGWPPQNIDEDLADEPQGQSRAERAQGHRGTAAQR